MTGVTADTPLSSSGGTSPNMTLGTVPVGKGGTASPRSARPGRSSLERDGDGVDHPGEWQDGDEVRATGASGRHGARIRRRSHPTAEDLTLVGRLASLTSDKPRRRRLGGARETSGTPRWRTPPSPAPSPRPRCADRGVAGAGDLTLAPGPLGTIRMNGKYSGERVGMGSLRSTVSRRVQWRVRPGI